MRHRHSSRLMPFIAALLLLGFTGSLWAAEPSAKDAQALIDGSVSSLGEFLDDKTQENFRDKLREAKGVVIMPRHVTAGLIVGGAGGKCTVLARYGDSNKWSQPWFCDLTAGSVGLQIGAGVSEVLILIMTDKGMEAVKKSQSILGRDASTADGSSPESRGDTLVFARKTGGAFAGSPLTGSVLSPADGLNNAYYGKVVTARDVFERKEVYNRDSSKLVSLVSRNAKVRRRR